MSAGAGTGTCPYARRRREVETERFSIYREFRPTLREINHRL